MTLDPSAWSKLHGATTHFPIALMLVAAFCDGVALLPAPAARRRSFRSAATVTLVLGALASYVTVASGLSMSHGQAWGHATLLRHHLFVWPAFSLMTGLAAWRLLWLSRGGVKPHYLYLSLMLLNAALMAGAGYWGGELLNEG